jgi:hypothetical protein
MESNRSVVPKDVFVQELTKSSIVEAQIHSEDAPILDKQILVVNAF